MMRILLVPALLACCSAPVGSSYDLPPALREVSGLALASQTSVFAHDDEQAQIFELDLSTGDTLRSFAIGNPPVRGDFEGVAADSRNLFLISSKGQLLFAQRSHDARPLVYRVHDTGTAAHCEVEGLSLAPAVDDLLILCKRVKGAKGGRLRIYRWSIRRQQPVQEPWIDLNLRGVLAEGHRHFSPSGLEWDTARRQLVVISAEDRKLLILSESGEVIKVIDLSSDVHAQPEGVTITPAGDLIVADEGKGGRSARLTTYHSFSPDR